MHRLTDTKKVRIATMSLDQVVILLPDVTKAEHIQVDFHQSNKPQFCPPGLYLGLRYDNAFWKDTYFTELKMNRRKPGEKLPRLRAILAAREK